MNILEETTEFVSKAVQNYTLGQESVDYAVGLGVVPDATGAPQMVTTVVLRMASIIVGESHAIGFFVHTPVPTQIEIDPHINAGLLSLRKMRDADLNIPQPGTASGLILK